MIQNTIEDFYKRIVKQDSGCWEFQSWADRDGYRYFTINGKEQRAHRFACSLDGRDPTGYVVRHQCDNPACVNPEHLILGTQQENNQDKIDRGRSKGNTGSNRGKGPSHKLSEELIHSIVNDPLAPRACAKKYGISQDTVTKYRKNYATIYSSTPWTHTT